MSETPKPAPAPQRSVAAQIGRAGCWSLAVVCFVFFVLMSGLLVLLQLPFILVTGWIQFLVRTVPNVTWNWDLVGMGIVSSALVLALAHWFLGWIVKSVASARGVTWEWPWKWTWCGLIAIALLFVVGMATGGVVHQFGWIVSSPEPWYERKGRTSLKHVANMKQLDKALKIALDEANGDIDNARRGLWKPESKIFPEAELRASMQQSYHLLVATGENGKVTGTIIFPRNAEKHSAAVECYFGSDGHFEWIPFAQLQELIQKNRTHLQAL